MMLHENDIPKPTTPAASTITGAFTLGQHTLYINEIHRSNQLIAAANQAYSEHFKAIKSFEALSEARRAAQLLDNSDATAVAQRILNQIAQNIDLVEERAHIDLRSEDTLKNIANALDNAYQQAAQIRNNAADAYRKYAETTLTTPALFDAEISKLTPSETATPEEINNNKVVKRTLMQVYPTLTSSDQTKLAERAKRHYDAAIEEANEIIQEATLNYSDFVSSLGTTSEIYYAGTLARSPDNHKEAKTTSLDILKAIPSYTLYDAEELSAVQKQTIEAAHRRLKTAYEHAEKLKKAAEDEYNKRTNSTLPHAALTAKELAEEEAHQKDNRLWYDVRKWTWPEIIGRLVALPYALLCGLSIEASLVGVGAGALFAGLSAFVSSSVNLKGFWFNVSTMLTDFFSGSKNSPKGIYRVIYLAYAFVFGLTLALLNTAMTLENVRATFGVSGDGFWETFYIPVIFGGTFVAVWGLFVQEQFKWLSSTMEGDVEQTPWMRFKRTISRILGIENDPNLLLEHEKGDINAKASILARTGRAALTLILTAVLAYGAYVIAPIVSETFTQGMSAFIHKVDFSHMFDKNMAGTDPGYANLLAPASSTFAVLFVIASTIYGLGLAKRLSDVATRFARGAHDWSLFHIYDVCRNKVTQCWQSAIEYGHKERIKGSIIPVNLNICLNFLFQNLALLVFWNAGNNAGLFVDTKLGSMEDKKAANNDEREEQGLPRESEDLTDKNKLKIVGTAISTFTRSAGFGLIATLEGTGGTNKPVVLSQNKNQHWNTNVKMTKRIC